MVPLADRIEGSERAALGRPSANSSDSAAPKVTRSDHPTKPVPFNALLPEPVPAKDNQRWTDALRLGVLSVFWFGSLIAVVGIGASEPWVVYAATALLGAGFVLTDVSRWATGGITCMTIFSIISVLTACANLVGLSARGSANHDVYFLYTAFEHLQLAAELGLAFAVLPMIGAYAVLRRPALPNISRFAPMIRSQVASPFFVWTAVLSSLVISAVHAANRHIPGGTVTFLILWWPVIAAFVLARLGASTDRAWICVAALVVALVESARAFFFGYLRGEIAIPLFAFLAGVVIPGRLTKKRVAVMIPALVVGSMWVALYGLLGDVRGRASGADKIPYLKEYHSMRQANLIPTPEYNIITRLTSFNQLSQIGHVVERDGFYKGQTFSYLAVVMVPRFLWPEKPKIALGSWYALRIGQAVENDDGSVTTSINMTQAGELYLNWGWLGVVVGLPIFGALLAVLWTRSDFWRGGAANVLGGALGILMMFMLLGAHGEFTALFTMLAAYLVLLYLSFVSQLRSIVADALRKHLSVPRAFAIRNARGWRAVPLAVRRWDEQRALE